MAIVNAVQLQLHERLLQLSSFDTMFSFLLHPPFNVEGWTCEGLEGEGGKDPTNGDLICAIIPNADYRANCTTIGEIKDPICRIRLYDPLLSTICLLLGSYLDAGCIDGWIMIRYRDGEIFFPTLSETEAFQFTCNDLMPAVANKVPLPQLGFTLDCADPLRLWERAENLLLNPLKDLTNCEPADFPENVIGCTGPDDAWYDNVPPKCFCDGLTMTDTVNNLVFKGAHSGMLLALHNVLETADLTTLMPNLFPVLQMVLPEILQDILTQLETSLSKIDLAGWIDNTLANMGMDLLDLKHGKFGFFRGPNGSNATRSWWKINSGKYQFDLYNQVHKLSFVFLNFIISRSQSSMG